MGSVGAHGGAAALERAQGRTAKLQSLQAMRGLAALLVVFSHVLRQTHDRPDSLYEPALLIGNLGVNTFFVISGYIMQYTAGGTFGRPGASGRFLRHRLARIVPLYWLFTALAIAFPGVLHFGHHVTLAGALLSFAFLPDTTHLPNFFPALVVGWSLSFEMLFYAAYALSLRFPPRIGIPALLAALAAFTPLMHLIASWTALPPVVRDFAAWWTQGALMLFVVGVLLAILEAKRGRVADRRNIGFCFAILLLLGCTAVFQTTLLPLAVEQVLYSLVPVAAIAFCILFEDLRDGRLSRPLVRLGDSSYGLYLGHLFVLGILFAAWQSLLGGIWPLAYGLLAVAACWAASLPLYRLVELRLTRRAKVLLVGRTPAAAPAGTG